MKNVKSQQGITLVALVITIVLMLILTGVTVYTGIDSYKNAQVSKFVAQMQFIQEKVDNIDKNDGIQLGYKPDDITQKDIIKNRILSENLISDNEEINDYLNWRYFSKEKLISDLGIEDIDDSLFINFETREVISTTGVYYNGKTHYTQYSLPGGQALAQNINENTEELTCKMNIDYHGLGATIKISDIKLGDNLITNGVLKYKEIENWINEIDYSKADGDSKDCWHEIQGNKVEISKAGYYVFCLFQNEKRFLIKNNVNGYDYEQIGIILANNYKLIDVMEKEPQDEEIVIWYIQDGSDIYNNWNLNHGDVARYDGFYYVWIPRCAYIAETKVISGESYTNYKVKYLKGNSNISTDGTILGDEWKIPEQFSDNNKNQEYRGIWLKTNSINDSDGVPAESFISKLLKENEYIPVE